MIIHDFLCHSPHFMPPFRNVVDRTRFNSKAVLPFKLRQEDFEMAKHSRTLIENAYQNGHPDLLVKGVYANNSVKAGSEGVEIKTTRKAGGAVDTHGAREQWMCVFVYGVDRESEPARDRRPMEFTEVYLGKVKVTDFRQNPRGTLGTRTATLHAAGVAKLRRSWVYRV